MSSPRVQQPRRLRHGALLTLPGSVIPGAASYVAFVAIGHVDSETTLGFVSLAWVIANMGSAFAGLGPSHTALREITAGADPADVRACFRTIVMRRSLALCGALAACGLVAWFALGEIGVVLVLATPWMFGQSFLLFETETMKASEHFGLVSTLLVARAAIGWGVSVVGAAAIGGIAAAVLPNAVVGIATAVAAGTHDFGRPTDADRSLDRSIGRPVGRLSIASYALGYGDFFVVQAILGPAAVGVYNLGYQLGVGIVEVATTPITTVALPRIVSASQRGADGRREAERTALRLGAMVIGISVVAPLCLLALVPTGVYELISPDPALPIVAAIVAVAVGVQSLTRLGYGFLLASGRTNTALRSFLVAGAVNLIAAGILTWLFGLVGTAIATVIGYGLLATITIWTVRQQ